MAIAAGTNLGPYEIVCVLGTGGMGEVYRATDTRLKRQVAIKVLPAALTADPDRLARFQREAEVLASLNHPNIAAIYGLEEADGVPALVMELVEGPTLADRMQGSGIEDQGSGSGVKGSTRTPMPIDEALPIARQIADALEAAHEVGVIHRDLKPANIKVRHDGTVKVLDFGLAKALAPAGAPGENMSVSPTMSMHATAAGIILGTAAYMSPEQARGRVVDRRADIWAFGVVLYEVLTGRRAFDGDDISTTLAAVLKDEVKWSALPADVPSSVHRLLRRCLERNPKRRLSAIGDARLDIDEAMALPTSDRDAATAASVAPSTWKSYVPWAVAAVAMVVAAIATVKWAPWRAPVELPRIALEVEARTAGTNGPFVIALSPDGRKLAARVTEQGISRIWIRALDQVKGAALPGTETPSPGAFWSPDGRTLGFFSAGKLKTVDVTGAPPLDVTDAPNGRGGSWNRDNVILFAPDRFGPLQRVPAAGGKATAVTVLDTSRGETAHKYPWFLPDGAHFLYLAVSSQPDASAIYVGSLAGGPPKRLVAATTGAQFAPPYALLFLRESTLMAQPFDPVRLEVSGEPIAVALDVGSDPTVTNIAGFGVSATGILAYRPGGTAKRQLVWTDRTGRVEGRIGDDALYENPRLSPDGKRVAFFKADGGGDIWVTDLERSTTMRLTLDPATDNIPVWSPDGKRIAFVSNRSGVFDIYLKSADGSGDEQLLLKTPHRKRLNDWSTDGRYLLYEEQDPVSGDDLWVLPFFGDQRPLRIMETRSNKRSAAFSPDGRWIAYTSDESGAGQVYVGTFPGSGSKWQIGPSGDPIWRRDGRELFFANNGLQMAVDVTGTGPVGPLKFGQPRVFFDALTNLQPHPYDVTPDGKHFLLVTDRLSGDDSGSKPIVVVLNWMSGMRQ